jgi:thiol:disulfide interchange protein
VQVKISKSVAWLLALSGLVLSACATSAREQPGGSAPASPAVATSVPASVVSAQAAPPASSAAPAAAPESKTGSAYFGCGQPIPLARLWDETSESQVLEAIGAAKSCAAEHERRLLLEFVAPWCEDCQEMAKLDATELVAATLKQRFERVRINVGKWDRHEGLRNTFGVHALATYVVLDPKTSKELAKTTLEPITKKGQKLSPEDWQRWLAAH